MRQELFIKAGLTKVQAEILDFLLASGLSKARDIAKKINRPRGVVYKGLEELAAMNLAEKTEKVGQVAKFRSAHPANLEKLFEAKQAEVNQGKQALIETLPDLVSAYNLSNNKPSIKLFEGEDGFKKILNDTLTSKTDICLLINTAAMAEEEKFKQINDEYKTKRLRAGIIKRIIRAGREANYGQPLLGEEYEKITEIKYAGAEANPFKASVQIYDNKISYLLIDQDKITALLIEDKNIYQMHKYFFEMLWQSIK